MSKPSSIGLRNASIHHFRLGVQTGIGLICLAIGVKFYLFVRYLESGGATPFVERPPGAEGFLPISSLMSVFYTLKTGRVDGVHPAGVVIFLAAVAMSVIVAKSFCGWICPVGFVSDLLESLRNRIFGKAKKNGPRPIWWRIVDGMMRSVKYLLLAFFAYAIIGMSSADLHFFLYSAYNVVADVKMYRFFANISTTAAVVITVLTVLSFLIPRFWCRYLCPYGALTGIAGLLSVFKIRRNADACVDCGACRRACPSRIDVDAIRTVRSDECISCHQCIAACPVKGALQLEAPVTRKPVSIRVVGLTAAAIFFVAILVARLAGYWYNSVPVEVYLELHEHIDELGHPRSPESLRELDDR